MDSEESRSTNTWPNQHKSNKDLSIEMELLAANGNKDAIKPSDEIFQDNGLKFEHDDLPIRPRRRQKSTRLTGTKEQLYHHVLFTCYFFNSYYNVHIYFRIPRFSLLMESEKLTLF